MSGYAQMLLAFLISLSKKVTHTTQLFKWGLSCSISGYRCKLEKNFPCLTESEGPGAAGGTLGIHTF